MVAYIYGRPLVIERLSWIKLKIIAWLKAQTAARATHTIQANKPPRVCKPRWTSSFYYFIRCLCLLSYPSNHPSINGHSCPQYYGIRWTNIWLYLLHDSTECQYYRIHFLNLNMQLMFFAKRPVDFMTKPR